MFLTLNEGFILSNFGLKLKELRNQASLTQEQLADKLGIKKATVSYYEKGERTPSPDVLIKIAEIFHVSTDYLLGIERTSYLDTNGLTEEDVRALRYLASYLHRKNEKYLMGPENG